VNFPIRGTGEKAWFGWPTDPKMEELREAWFNAPDAASSKIAADAVQKEAFEFVPIIPTGRFIEGMPMGLQVVGPYLEDRTTLRFAQLVEATLGGGYVPPPTAN